MGLEQNILVAVRQSKGFNEERHIHNVFVICSWASVHSPDDCFSLIDSGHSHIVY